MKQSQILQQKTSGLNSLRWWFLLIVVINLIQLFLIDFADPYSLQIIIYAGINIILAVSLNLVNGFTGQFSMGHAGFMSVGGYVAAILSVTVMKFVPDIYANPATGIVTFIAVLLAGGLAASAAGYIVGLPSLRLKGDYLAIVTLGFGEIIRVLVLNLDFLGGARGLSGIPSYTNFAWVYTFAALTVFFTWRLIASPHGRALLAVREDEIAAEAMGVHTTQAKVRAFVIGAFFAGIAGGLFGHELTILTPAQFDFNRSFEIIIMVVLGGMGSISGSVIAAVFLTFLREALRPLQEITQLDFRMIIYSFLLIVLMLVRPNGLLGKTEIVPWVKGLMLRFQGRGAG